MPLASKPMIRVGLALLASLAAVGSLSQAQGAEPVQAPNQYLEFIRGQAEALRAGERPPETIPEWEAQAATVRKGLQKAWGEFPAQPCPLEPQVLGILDRDGYRVEKVVFQTRPGLRMTANAYVPNRPGKHPAILAVHGHWKGAKQDPVVQARCIGAAKLGFFVLAVDAFGAGERGVGKALGEYHGEMTGATLLPVGLPLSGIQVYENMRAVDYLLTRPEVDGAHIGITGASGGGNQSMYSGAWDDRLKAVVPVCSVGNYRAYLGAACCICEMVPGALRFAEEWGVLGLTAPRNLLIVNATQDASQFSVEAAKRTLTPLQQVYRLHGDEGHLRHAIFESKHDYNQAMREAMYGWMTLHLKGEGDGAPIAEPEMKTEDPETLRCYPGDTRPDDWMTLPRFAAAEGRKLVAAKAVPGDANAWRTEAETRRKALVDTVFGGFPTVPPISFSHMLDGSLTTLFESEPGMLLSLGAAYEPAPFRSLDPKVQEKADQHLAIVIDLDGPDTDGNRFLVSEVSRAGWRSVPLSLRTTGRNAWPTDKIGQAPDHNSAEWALWIGRPLLGQWVFEVRRLLDAIEKKENRLPANLVLIGKGPAGLVALCAGAVDPRITKVAAVGTLASYITEEPYVGQRLGVMAPGILREVGDVAHLAALNAPKRMVIAGGVAGNGTTLSAEAVRDVYQPAAHAWELLNAKENFRLIDGTDPADVLEALR
ncbi:Acetyl xylan esterase (AXE1) [Singulisphaera sp. GP187]|uniref:alpha/beta hydrolase family protein n=1 Tax=Singulisphaera sp. GP187 TaxID=1882752 RepID=UPI00092CB91D|nr:acetylxylan esterase [Singulisphaera sp. GP187]SIO41266.1 Acetyl xylan esterase (AXE1) [Singulisphaera sp. GP187]